MPLTLPSFLPRPIEVEPVRRIPIQSVPGANWTGPRWAIIPSRVGGWPGLVEVMVTGSLRESVGASSSELILVVSCFACFFYV